MRYIIEPIGAQFSQKNLPTLAQVFTQRRDQGYRLHSVFQAQQPGCMFGSPTITYFAIYEWVGD